MKLPVSDYIDNTTNFGQGNGCVTPQPLPGWTPDGQNEAFTQSGLVISRMLRALLGAGEYTFRIYIGNRADSMFLTSYTVDLLAGSTVIGSSADTVSPAGGEFLQDSFAVDIAAGDSLVGQPLGIALSAAGAGQTNFDLAQLDFVPAATSNTREPSTILPSAAAFAALFRVKSRC